MGAHDTRVLIDAYVTRLNSTCPDGYEFYVRSGRKYHKVIMRNGGSQSVHAFVDGEGAVIKPASWREPQRSSDGTLAVRWRLSDDSEREELFTLLGENPACFSGSYLYQR